MACVGVAAVVFGCGNGGSGEATHPAPEQTKAAPAPAKESCDAQRAMLAALADEPPPGFPDEAIVFGGSELPIAAAMPIPMEDQRLATAAVHLGTDDVPPPPPSAPPSPDATHVYVHAAADVSIAEVRKVATRHSTLELRLLVRKPTASLVGAYLKMFPNTSKSLVEKLPEFDDLVTAGPELSRLAKSCDGLSEVTDLLMQGAGIDVTGPATSDALATCDCGSEDVQSFVSLLLYISLPLPQLSYVPLDREKLTAAGATTTVGAFVTGQP